MIVVGLLLVLFGTFSAAWGFELWCSSYPRIGPVPPPRPPPPPSWLASADPVERWILAGGTQSLDEFLERERR